MKNSLLIVVMWVFGLMAANAYNNKPYSITIEVPDNYVKQPREVDSFNSLRLVSSIDVVLKQGDQQTVVVEALDQYVDRMITKTQGETLIVDLQTDGFMTFRGRMQVVITLPRIQSIEIRGSGNVTGKGLFNCRNLDIQVHGSGDLSLQANTQRLHVIEEGSGDIKFSGATTKLDVQAMSSGDISLLNLGTMESCFIKKTGSGDVRLSGAVDYAELNLDGSGDYYGEALICRELVMEKDGSGDARVQVKENMIVDANGSGDVIFSGQPAIKQFSQRGSGEIYRK